MVPVAPVKLLLLCGVFLVDCMVAAQHASECCCWGLGAAVVRMPAIVAAVRQLCNYTMRVPQVLGAANLQSESFLAGRV